MKIHTQIYADHPNHAETDVDTGIDTNTHIEQDTEADNDKLRLM